MHICVMYVYIYIYTSMYICMYPADIPGNVAQVKRTKRDRAQRYNQGDGQRFRAILNEEQGGPKCRTET